MSNSSEKCYNPQDRTLTFVDGEDELDCKLLKQNAGQWSCRVEEPSVHCLYREDQQHRDPPSGSLWRLYVFTHFNVQFAQNLFVVHFLI